jgi:hypothetical protein
MTGVAGPSHPNGLAYAMHPQGRKTPAGHPAGGSQAV